MDRAAAEVLALDPSEFWFIAVLIAAAAAGALFFGFRALHRARVIADIPTSRIRSAAQGYVELVGEAALLPGEPIVSLLTGTVCTWFHCRVEERVTTRDSRGNTQTRWRTVRDERSGALFLLRDDTGECVIDPDGAHVLPSVSHVWFGGSSLWHGAPARRTLFSSGRYRFTENRIEVGDPLYAIGEFRTTGGAYESGGHPGDEVRAVLAEWKRDQPALLARFDTNRDGRIDLEEWEAARRAAERHVVKARAARAAEPGVHLMARPSHGQPYLLSAVPEEELVRRLRWQGAGTLAAFVACITAAAWMLSVRLGT
ncbi:MAG: GIDE domain-containing protein [Thiohalomonadaceae bacterium]